MTDTKSIINRTTLDSPDSAQRYDPPSTPALPLPSATAKAEHSPNYWDKKTVAIFSAGTGVAFGVSGAAIGTAIAPGLGTLIGFIVGVVVGILFGIVTTGRHNDSSWDRKKIHVEPPLLVKTD